MNNATDIDTLIKQALADARVVRVVEGMAKQPIKVTYPKAYRAVSW